jgi:hypothetical protein
VSYLRELLRVSRAALPASCAIILFLIASVQIEQQILRRRAERLLTDIRSLQIHQSTLPDVEKLGRRWGTLTRWDKTCDSESCGFEILWSDFYLWHLVLFTRFNLLHPFMLAGGRPQQVWAGVLVEKGAVIRKDFHVVVGVPGEWSQGRWWDYPLMGNAGSDPNLLAAYRPPSLPPLYIVGRPGGCDGPCKEVHFAFDPRLDSATVDRLMQFDLSCLTRWIHPCRNESDIMPNAWAQYKIDDPQTSD